MVCENEVLGSSGMRKRWATWWKEREGARDRERGSTWVNRQMVYVLIYAVVSIRCPYALV